MKLKILHQIDPLIYFLVGAIALFGINALLESGRKPSIELSKPLQQSLLDQAESMKGTTLNDDERKKTLEDYINQEIIFTDAIQLGLHKHASIRSTLTRRYRALLTAALPDPSDEELIAHYENNIADYTLPRLYDVEYHLITNNDTLPTANNEDISQSSISAWLGLPTQHQQHHKISERDILMLYGKNISEALPLAPMHNWIGPIRNFRGGFYFRVNATTDGTQQPFEEVRTYVRDAWMKARQDRVLAEKVAALKTNYRIHIQD